MNKMKWKWILPIACVALLIVALLIGVWIWRNVSFGDAPFGYQYSVVSVFFSDRDIPAYAPEIAEYALTDDGMLLDIHGNDSGRLSSSFRKFSLKEETFDDLFAEDGSWRVSGIDADAARKNNVDAWQYRKMNGDFYYVLLQKNGDVFLCIGEDGAICQFFWLQALGRY